MALGLGAGRDSPEVIPLRAHDVRRKDAMNPLPAYGHLSRALNAAADTDDLTERKRRPACSPSSCWAPPYGPSTASWRGWRRPPRAPWTPPPARTPSHGRRTNGPELATDPDAGWYVHEGDHRDPDAPVSDAVRPPPQARRERRPRTRRVDRPAASPTGTHQHLIEQGPAVK
ncbi:hypothetical protein WJ438_20240 [Streptomyces sp. GD-15H]|uniref:hypothetical protein n=1 Tax=Streptomyces sp. GD-15H TaxID=3129112 RepID=UPI003245751D